jgi:HSP20 family protein
MPVDAKRLLAIDGQELAGLRGSLRRLFVELLAADESGAPAPGQWSPPVDLSESPDMITIKVELPGVEREDIRVALAGNVLKISGNKREEPIAARPVCYICLERNSGQFTRTLNLDWAIDAQMATAELTDGLLTIRLPKLKDRRKREIIISIS